MCRNSYVAYQVNIVIFNDDSDFQVILFFANHFKQVVKEFWREAAWIFRIKKVNMTPAGREICSRLQQSRWCCYCFLLRIPQQWLIMLFSGPDNAKICRFPLVDLGPIQYMVPLAHPSLSSNRHLDRFSRFCRAHKRDQQTNTHTQADHATPCVATGRIWLLLYRNRLFKYRSAAFLPNFVHTRIIFYHT